MGISSVLRIRSFLTVCAVALGAWGWAAAAASAATPLNLMNGNATKGTFTCAKNERSATFDITGNTTGGFVGSYEASGSATFGPPDEFGFGAVTSLHMKFSAVGPAGKIADGKLDGGGGRSDFGIGGACGNDVDFGYELVIDGVKNVTWSADVKTRLGAYHDHGPGNVNNFSIYGKHQAARGIAPNLTSKVTGKPVNVNPPTLTGTPSPGNDLTCHSGDWIGAALPASTYEWLSSDVVVASHNGPDSTDVYSVQNSDANHDLQCRVTVDRGFGLNPATAVSQKAGTAVCAVPKLRGKSKAKAKSALASGHCALGKVSKEKQRGVPVGHVLSQSAPPGTIEPAGFKVDVVVRKH